MNFQASCAICGAPPSKNCGHEDERLKIALFDAQQRWIESDMKAIRNWVLNHAREWILFTFNQLATIRRQQYEAHLQSLPCYSLYQIYKGSPPISPPQLHQLQVGIDAAKRALQSGIDADWQASLQRYPEVLDHFFSLVELTVPSDKSLAQTPPQFGSKKRRNSEEKPKPSRHKAPPIALGPQSGFHPGAYPTYNNTYRPGF